MAKLGLFLFLITIVLFIGCAEAAPSINFTSPTLNDSVGLAVTSVEINVSLNESDLGDMKLSWDGNNYSFYDDTLVLMYNFNNLSFLGENETNAVDVSRYGNNGTWWNSTTGNITHVSSKYGKGIVFDGFDDYIHIDNLDLGVEEGSMEVWVNFENATGVGTFFDDYSGGSVPRFRLAHSDNYIQLFTNGILRSNQATTLTNGTWYHIVAVYNSSGAWVYKNAGLVDSYTENASLGATVFSPNIGSKYDGATDFLNGTLDEFRIWNRSLTFDEIKQHYYGNLHKYDTNKWNFYTNETGLAFAHNYTYYAFASNTSGKGSRTVTKSVRYAIRTKEYYDNRKAAVVWTGDDWNDNNNYYFIKASNQAQSKGVVFSPGVITNQTNSSTWAAIQNEMDEGFVSPVSHSFSHDITTPYDNTTLEVCGSQSDIINNLTLPWQNRFNGSQYMVGWIRPGGNIDTLIQENLSLCNYLIDRPTDTGSTNWGVLNSYG